MDGDCWSLDFFLISCKKIIDSLYLHANFEVINAGMAEVVDAQDLKSCGN